MSLLVESSKSSTISALTTHRTTFNRVAEFVLELLEFIFIHMKVFSLRLTEFILELVESVFMRLGHCLELAEFLLELVESFGLQVHIKPLIG